MILMMKKKHTIVELPKDNGNLDKIISDEKHNVQEVSLSSVVVNGEVKHFVLVVWHDEEYGDHQF
jgi:hypothetical protein